MQITITKDNKMKCQFNKTLNETPTITYLTDGNRIYKLIYNNKFIGAKSMFVGAHIFAFNKHNGRFDKLVYIITDNGLKNWEDARFLDTKTFYTEVLNIIRRRYILGLMINTFKEDLSTRHSFDEYYMSDYVHKGTFLNIVHNNDIQTNADLITLIDNISNQTKIPQTLSSGLRYAMDRSFYRNEMPRSKRNDIISDLIKKEIYQNKSPVTSKRIWVKSLDEMKQKREEAMQLLQPNNQR